MLFNIKHFSFHTILLKGWGGGGGGGEGGGLVRNGGNHVAMQMVIQQLLMSATVIHCYLMCSRHLKVDISEWDQFDPTSCNCKCKS